MPGNVNVDVGGYRGVLENAATESTLAQLLAETKKHNPSLVGAIKQLAQSAGLRAEDIKQFENAARGAADSTVQLTAKQKIVGAVMQDLTAGAVQTAKNLAALTSNVLDGTLAANNFFRALESLPLGLGKVAALFSALSEIQQKSLDSYRVMSSAGVNLGGGLIKIRENALSLGLTLDQYSQLVAKNSSTFALMGNNADAGAESFQRVAKELRNSPMNRQLMAMGLSAEGITQGLADYIRVTGGANVKTVADQKALSDAAGEYMVELQALSKLSGQTREEQQQAAAEAANDAAYQLALSKMTVEQKKEVEKGRIAAEATGQKGIVESYRAQISGSLVYTNNMRATTSVLPEATAQFRNLAENAKKGIADEKMRTKAFANASAEIVGVSKKFGDAAPSLMQMGNDVGNVLIGAAKREVRSINQGIDSADGFTKQLETSRKAVADLKGSEADQAAEVEKAFKDLGLAVSTLLLPVIKGLTLLMNNLILTFKDGIIKGFLNMFTSPLILGPVALSIVAMFTMMKAKAALLDAAGATGAASATRDAAAKTKGIASKVAKVGAFGAVGAGLDYSADKLKESGHDQLGAGASALGSAAQGAALGMMLGPIGALIGGAAGLAYGYYQNSDALMGKPKEEKRAFGSFGSTGSLFEDFGAKKSVELHGMEAVVTPDQMSKLMQGSAATGIGALAGDIQQLNAMTSQVLRTLMTIADNTKRGVDATKSLNGNLFAR